MVKYLVNYTVRHEVYEMFVTWLREEHLGEMLKTPGFTGAELCLRKGGNMEASSRDVKVIYSVANEDDIKAYIQTSAMELRGKALEKFPGQFSAHREVWLESITIKSN